MKRRYKMEITIKFERDVTTKEEMIDLITVLKGFETSASASETKFVKAKKVENLSEIQPSEADSEESDANQVQTYTLDDAKKLATDKIKTHRAEIRQILDDLGAKKVTDLTDDTITQFVKQVKALA